MLISLLYHLSLFPTGLCSKGLRVHPSSGFTTSAPLVTVITVTFNSSRTLQFTLDSPLNQDFQAFEAWVVGDTCTDESETVVTSFGDRRLYWTNLPENSGSHGGPNNEGLQRARGRYIAYLGHNDLWCPEFSQKSSPHVFTLRCASKGHAAQSHI
jgi:Glycosyl transferase family 2